MSKTEYFKNLLWPVFIFSLISVNLSREPESLVWQIIWGVSVFNTFLYPFSKYAIERFALRFTSREYWHSGMWLDTPAKNPLYALYFILCFAVAIPVCIIYFLVNLTGKNAA
ncbi:MAG: colicin E1 family microcin immunity protein [Pantoea sp.]|uniref:colicin E1 family microcin immunity protein n=1 Tax=Pantoea sp. TaxID=69393 RepID=UPI0039E4CB8F